MRLLVLVTLLFTLAALLLKVFGVVTLPWLAVFAPLLALMGLGLLVLVTYGIVVLLIVNRILK